MKDALIKALYAINYVYVLERDQAGRELKSTSIPGDSIAGSWMVNSKNIF